MNKETDFLYKVGDLIEDTQKEFLMIIEELIYYPMSQKPYRYKVRATNRPEIFTLSKRIIENPELCKKVG